LDGCDEGFFFRHVVGNVKDEERGNAAFDLERRVRSRFRGQN
jgi:hypothetical protein